MQSVIPASAPTRRRPAGALRLLLVTLVALLLLGTTAWLAAPDGASGQEGPRGAPFRWMTIARGIA